MAYIGQCFGADSGNTTPSSLAAVYSAGVSAGHLIVIALIYAGVTVSSVADDAGNTLTVRQTGTDGTYTSAIASVANCAAVTTSNTLTITMSGAGSRIGAAGLDFSTGSGVFDTGAGWSSSTLTASTGAVAQSSEILVAAFTGFGSGGSQSFTQGASWTAGASHTWSIAGPFVFWVETEYQIITNGSTAYSGSCTLGTAASNSGSAIATFRDVVPNPVAPGTFVRQATKRASFWHHPEPRGWQRSRHGLYLPAGRASSW